MNVMMMILLLLNDVAEKYDSSGGGGGVGDGVIGIQYIFMMIYINIMVV